MESALRPRDIQARIRAGESPEDVAAAAQTSVDSIMAFAEPVLAERAHVARTAQKASVRRRAEGVGIPRTLGESAGSFFRGHHVDEEAVAWDAWRQADGRWALVAEYAVGSDQRRAEFTHDLPGKYVVAENDEARMLTGELKDPAVADRPAEQPRRLTAVRTEDELPLGDDAIELVKDREPAVEAEPEPEDDTHEDVFAEEVEAPEEEEPELDEPSAEEPPADEKPKKGKPKRKGRSQVPSWDEIMFGGGPGGQ